jgi:hypothetical protein
MAVNDQTVLAHIDAYQGRFMTSNTLERNRLAFRAIKDFRNGAGDSGDESLAAAEHYLFARFMVSNAIVSKSQMVVMVLGYDGVKALAQTNSYTEMAMRHNKDRATSRVSTDSVAWGLKGAEEGDADRLAHAADRAAPGWNWDAMKFGGATDAMAEMGKKVY